MNRKNRMAALASQASVQFNTFLFFKNLREKQGIPILEQAMVMRVTNAGVYVMIKSYGIEGLLTEEEKAPIVVDVEKEEAVFKGGIGVRAFDTIMIEIVAQSVEFRRQIKLLFRDKVEAKEEQIEEAKDLSEALVKKSKKKKK